MNNRLEDEKLRFLVIFVSITFGFDMRPNSTIFEPSAIFQSEVKITYSLTLSNLKEEREIYIKMLPANILISGDLELGTIFEMCGQLGFLAFC